MTSPDLPSQTIAAQLGNCAYNLRQIGPCDAMVVRDWDRILGLMEAAERALSAERTARETAERRERLAATSLLAEREARIAATAKLSAAERKIERLRAGMLALIPDIIREVAELPDRTSPDYNGEHMIVDAQELTTILRGAFEDLIDAALTQDTQS